MRVMDNSRNSRHATDVQNMAVCGQHTHTRSLAGPDQAESPAPPRKKVAVAGPPFVVIIMALRCRCPSPLRIERGHLNRPAEQPRKTRCQAYKHTHATPADATHHRQKPTAAYAPEMIIRRWWRGLAHPHTSHADQPPSGSTTRAV